MLNKKYAISLWRKRLQSKRCFASLIFFISILFSATVAVANANNNNAVLLTVDSAIGPATVDYIETGLQAAATNKAKLIILEINTPGGLDQSMRSIISKILAAPIPVIAYVAPSGARAASAGTFILYASHIAAMAPGTNIGAATPVRLNDENKTEKNLSKTDAEKKVLNDALAYIRSLAQLRNRNADWGELAIKQGASLTATEALKMNVIDIVAPDLTSLLTQVNGRTVSVQNRPVIIQAQDLNLITVSPSWRLHFLSVITEPNIAYILLIMGMWGLFFEFFNPGLVLPGVTGAICLLLGLYALQLLPINYAALGLIMLGVAFLAAELFLQTFGVLAIGGLIAFVMGSILLLDQSVPGFQIAYSIIITLTILTAGFFLIVLRLAFRSQHKPIVSGVEALIGSVGEVIIVRGQPSRARIMGELWQVKANETLTAGQTVRVIGKEGLILIVKPVNAAAKKQ